MSKARKIIKSLTEDDGSTYNLIFSEKSTQPSEEMIDYLMELDNGVSITDSGNDAPVAWDAGWEIEGNNLVISGGVSAGGFGNVVITLPKERANEFYRFEIYGNDYDMKTIKEMLKEFNIDLEKQD